MYEAMTYDYIMRRMVARVLASNANLDTREGSIIYNALAAAAFELQNMYIELEVMLKETFADTATRHFLILRAAERGIAPYPSTKAVLQGEFNIDIPLGSRFSCENLNYTALEKIEPGKYTMQCETSGATGNQTFGNLIPIDYIAGLTFARLTALLIPGEDEEETEHFRQRYKSSLDTEAFGGNITDYKEKTIAIDGVGGVKVYPVWNGGGTVKVVIIGSDYKVPSDILIETVQTLLDPVENQGVGLGIAPIGHVVTVAGCTDSAVSIASNITYQDEWTWDDVKPYAEAAVDDYFKSLGAEWDSQTNLIVRISQIEIRFLNLPGVLDIADTTINGAAQNLQLGADEIPLRGEIYG